MNESTSTPGLIANLGSIVLGGGKSTRMGVNKSELIFQGETFLNRVISRVSLVTCPVVVASGTTMDLGMVHEGVRSVADQLPDQGPLEGIRVGLQDLAAEVEFAFVTCCDVPLVEPAIIRILFHLMGTHQAVIPVQGDRVFGLTAVYRTDIANQLQSLIEEEKLRVRDLVDHLDARKVDVDELREQDPCLNSLTNINSLEEYSQLLERFKETVPGKFISQQSSKSPQEP